MTGRLLKVQTKGIKDSLIQIEEDLKGKISHFNNNLYSDTLNIPSFTGKRDSKASTANIEEVF